MIMMIIHPKAEAGTILLIERYSRSVRKNDHKMRYDERYCGLLLARLIVTIKEGKCIGTDLNV